MSAYTLTPEQAAIVAAYKAGLQLVVTAGAGSGKTSTLRACAEAVPRRRACYIAYNRAIKTDAARSFPRHVHCSTAHGLAWGAVGSRYQHRLDSPRMSARAVAQALGVFGRPPFEIELGERNVVRMDQTKVVRIALATITRFCQSASVEIDATHVPTVLRIETPKHREQLADVVVPLASRIWDDVTDVGGVLPFTHDCYLKMWQLQGPRIGADVVLLDEAQDANPVIASIVDAQKHAQRVLVGDQQQQLYAWRGAVDAMSRFACDERLVLSQSFRFGPAIADEANRWLDLLDAPLRIRGFDKVGSRVGLVDKPSAILCRTNAGALGAAMGELEAGRRVSIVGGDDQIRKLAEASLELQAGHGTSHPELMAFASWDELVRYTEEEEAGSDLRTIVRMVEDHGAQRLISICDKLTADEQRADVVVSTAHRSKGREWDRVRVAQDFRAPRGDGLPPVADMMLAYVTVTRAKLQLDRGSLSYVDELVGGGS